MFYVQCRVYNIEHHITMYASGKYTLQWSVTQYIYKWKIHNILQSIVNGAECTVVHSTLQNIKKTTDHIIESTTEYSLGQNVQYNIPH